MSTTTLTASPVGSIVETVRNRLRLLRWHTKGCPAPPPHIVKQRAIVEQAERFGIRNLVETGTFRGDMIAAMLGRFETIYSIELSEEFHRAACERFATQPHVRLVQGDSGEKLAEVVEQLDGPALFWLDGHYSGGNTAQAEIDTPIFGELATLFAQQPLRHVILIDDARLFGSDPGYPTIEQLQKFVSQHAPGAGFVVANDAIRITPAA